MAIDPGSTERLSLPAGDWNSIAIDSGFITDDGAWDQAYPANHRRADSGQTQ